MMMMMMMMMIIIIIILRRGNSRDLLHKFFLPFVFSYTRKILSFH